MCHNLTVQKDRILSFVCCFFILTVFAINFFYNAHRPLRDFDESAWIYSAYYYDLAFVQKNWESPDWQALDAIDHPPLFKYALGGVLALVGIHFTTPDLKEWWHANDENISHFV